MLEMDETSQLAIVPCVVMVEDAFKSNSRTAFFREAVLVKVPGGCEGGEGGEGGEGEGEDDAVARSTGSHCGGQVTPQTEGSAFELGWSTSLLGTQGLGTCGLLLLVVNGQHLSEQQVNLSGNFYRGQPGCQKASRGLRCRALGQPQSSRLTQVGNQVGHSVATERVGTAIVEYTIKRARGF